MDEYDAGARAQNRPPPRGDDARREIAATPRIADGTRPIVVEFSVRNTGRRRGAEVPLVYLGLPTSAGEPPKRLVGFEKVWLDPGQRRRVRVTSDPRTANHRLGTWETTAQTWVAANGAYRVHVGRSATDPVLTNTVTLRSPTHGR